MKTTSSSKRSGVSFVAAATVLSAASGFLVTLIAAHALDPGPYAHFAAAWGLLYLIVGALNGIQQEASRAVAVQETSLRPDAGHTHLAFGVFAFGALVAICASFYVMLAIGNDGFDMATQRVLWAVIPACIFIAGQMLFSGALTGSDRLLGYASVISLEATTRLVLFVCALIVFVPSTALLVLFAILPFAMWLLLLLQPDWRRLLTSRAEGSFWKVQQRFVLVGVATVLTSLLTTGFPLLLHGLSRDASNDELGILVLLITLTRAPLLVPLTSFQSTLVSWLIRNRERAHRVVLLLAAGTVLIGAAVAAVAAWLGPWAIRTVFGAEYDAQPNVLFNITVCSVSLALLMIASCVALAQNRQAVYLLSWMIATGAAIAFLLLPLSITVRCYLALGIGPLLGVVVSLIAAPLGQHRHSASAQDE